MDERQALAQLRDVLANLYSDVATIRRVVHDAGLNEERIDFSQRAQDSWHAVLREAQKHERVEVLLEIATKEYANNPALQAAWKNYQTATTPQNQVTHKQRGSMAALQFTTVIVVSMLILFIFVDIIRPSITEMLMLSRQPVITSKDKVTNTKVAEVTVAITMSATTEAKTLPSPTRTLPLVDTLTPLMATSMPTTTFTPLPAEAPTAKPTPLPTSTPGPCLGKINSHNELQTVNVHKEYQFDSKIIRQLPNGVVVEIKNQSKAIGGFYYIWSITGSKFPIGWIDPNEVDVYMSPTCPQ